MIVIIDNYDSFTYNLYQYIGEINPDIRVYRNDKITVEELSRIPYSHLIISPGPGYPQQAGVSVEAIQKLKDKAPILGVCLGHQAIGCAFGAKIVKAPELMHGKASDVRLEKSAIFEGLPPVISGGRYHSLMVDKDSLPRELKITASSESGEIMAIEHRELPIYGLQIHPESILTQEGRKILRNFLAISKGGANMFKETISKILDRQDLTREQAREAMNEIMGGKATPAQIGGFLTAMRMKGETVDEITGFAQSMRENAQTISPDVPFLTDTCGTGGDGAHTFNISTAAAIVASAAGVPVAKHGNRSVSSSSGSADVLEKLGVAIDLGPNDVSRCIEEIGLGFMFAPVFHGAMKHAIGPRRELGVRTVFNMLGPLTNPAGAGGQLMGVYSEELTEPVAKVLGNLGVKRAMVVYSRDGLDEISVCAPTTVSELKDGEINTYSIDPEEYGFSKAGGADIKGEGAEQNAQIITALLKGEKGAKRDILLINAGAAIYIGGGAGTIAEGIEKAAEAIDSGKAYKKLRQLVDFTRNAKAS